jgi:hypothetical protein
MWAGGYETSADLLREMHRRGIHSYDEFTAVIERETH